MYIVKVGDMVLNDNEHELCVIFWADAHAILLPYHTPGKTG